jgi:hypothetical protein
MTKYRRVGRRATIEQADDVRVLESGQDLALVAEPPEDGIGVHPALDQFSRHFLVLAISPFAEIAARCAWAR